MNGTLSLSDEPTLPRSRVSLSPWVNEPLPPFQELLSAHDVARLTRRPRLVISGLVLLRRFPKKRCYRGRQVGWLRSDVLDWLSRDLTIRPAREFKRPMRRCAKTFPQQPCLPFECSSSCGITRVIKARRATIRATKELP